MRGNAWKILIIDGSAAARAELRGLLEQGSARRYEVFEAETGSAAAQLCAREALPDCVLLAAELPDMDALGALMALRGNKELPQFAVVVVAEGAGPARDVRRALLQAGAMEIVGKASMDAEALNRAVENAVDRLGLPGTADQAAQASLLLTRHVLDNLFAFVGVLELDGTLVEANRAPLEAAGIDLADVRGKKFWDCFWWDYADEVRAQVRDACERAARGEVVRYDVPVRMAGDTRALIDFQIAPLRQADGTITHLIPSAVDITERKRVEFERERLVRELQVALDRAETQQAQLEAVIEAMADGVVVFDMAGNVVLLNEAEARINGFASAAEMRRDLAFFAEIYELSYDDGRPVPVEEWPVSRVLRGEIVVDWRLHARRRDTGQAWYIDFSGAPVHDRNGNQVLSVVITRDVTDQTLAEEALRRSERRLSRMFETNLLGILYWDMSGGVHDANDAFLDIVGYSREDLHAGRIDWAKMTPPEYRAQDERALDDLRRTGMHAPIEKQYIRKDGSRVWILVGSTVIEGTSGAGFVLDITERKLAEEALRASEARARAAAADAEAERLLLDTVLEAAPVGIVVANPGGKILRMNPANERLWGPAPSSESVSEYQEWKGWWADGSERHGRLVQPEEWALARALRGEIARNDVCEVEPFDAPGTRRTMLNSGAPVRDASGRILGAIIAQMDITALIQAEAARRESEARFRALADNISQLAWIGDEKGWLFWYNKRWFDYTGTTLEQMEGWGWKSVHHPDHIDRVVAKFARHIETGEAWEDTFPLRGDDGTYRWFLSRAQPIRDDAGKVVLWFGTNTDITAQRDAEEALREASRRKDAFLAMLAHELRNPLAPVRTAVHILRKIGSQEPKAMRARDIIERQVAHMARLIDDLLDVSRITRGKLELHKERCDLAHIVAQTIEDYRANIESGGLALTVSVPREPLWVEGDPTRLVQMVGNVLQNASRFTENGGYVAVRAFADQQSHAAIVTVEDTGVGMEPALLSRLFDPFSQAEQGIDRSKGGLGLGLALVKGLIELHGGSVTAHSEGLGRGSTFTLRLPLAEAEAQKDEDQAVSTAAGGLRVVLIEDNVDAAETLAEWLSLTGHEVRVAHDGRAGIDLVREAVPEVVISDIGLPGGTDGYAVARALRAEPSVGSAFMIALSGYAQEEDQRRSREAGFDEHLAKPPDLQQLEAMLARGRRRG